VSTGSQGGAIWASGNTSIIDSTIVGNSAGVVQAAGGGVATTNELFFTIDADLIIGGPGQLHLFEDVLSVVAPTVIIGSPRDHENGVLEGVKEATRLIATIWDIDDRVDTAIADLSTRYAALAPIVSQSSGLSVSLNAANGGFFLASDAIVDRSLLSALGFTSLDHSLVPEHFLNATTMRNYADARTNMEIRDVMMMFMNWVEEQNPQYIIIFDNVHTTLAEAEAAGNNVDFSAIRGLSAYQEGRVIFQRNSSSTFGLTRMDLQLEDLENLFLP
jgi:ABC-type enterochelin transport system substrate-binding protein